jgi:phosphoenolpyruvate carboxykinase (ATP)
MTFGKKRQPHHTREAGVEMEIIDLMPDYQLDPLGLRNLGHVCWNISTPELYEHAVRRYECQISHLGPLVVCMGQHIGRAAKDKFIVDEPKTRDDIWWGKIIVKYPVERFDARHKLMAAYLRGETVSVQGCYAGADE